MGRFAILIGALLGLAWAPARAGDYRVSGAFVDAETGERSRVAGGLSLELLELEVPDGATVAPETQFIITDFAIALGERVLRPAGPVEFEGIPSLFPQLADSLLLDGRDVIFFNLRAGGDLVAVAGDEVTMRFYDLRTQEGHAPAGGKEPKRFRVEGELLEVEQTFRVRREPCGNPLPGDGGGVVIGIPNLPLRSGGGTRFGRRDFVVAPDADVDAIVNALQIDAPAGIEGWDDGAGGITLASAGDLFVGGGTLADTDLTRLTLEASGSVRVEGSLLLPLGARLEIVTDGAVDVGDDVVISAPALALPTERPPILFELFCPGLMPRFPALERALGTLRLEAVHHGPPQQAQGNRGRERR